MILQALEAYYHRKQADDPENRLAPQGWEWKEIPFLIVIDDEGNFHGLEDTREAEGKVLRGKRFLVPQGVKRTVGIAPNLCWDNVEYALGANPRERSDVAQRHEAFIEAFRTELGPLVNESPFCSVETFLANDPLKQIEEKTEEALLKELLEKNAFVTFRIKGSGHATICDSLKSSDFTKASGNGNTGICLITGEKTAIASLHPAIKGVRGCNTSGGALTSFNLSAFESFGKKQNSNAPVGEEAAFAYTAALNLLLDRNSENKTFVGDATAVFWAEKPEIEGFSLEVNLPWFLTDPPKDDPDRGVRAVKSLLQAVRTGDFSYKGENRFYLLGLSPNAARIAVRFWRIDTVKGFSERLALHFKDLEIVRGPNNPEHLSLSQLLQAIALERKPDNIPPNLAGQVVTSAFDGTPYPRTLLARCVARVRAEKGSVSYARAAILKACLNREYRRRKGEEFTVTLDRNRTDIGYRLGRLFAVLEKIQTDASPQLNATIRDRFYGAASTSPVTVFSQLLKLKNHHLAKIDNPAFRAVREREIGEIMDGIDAFPRHLTLDEQALFAVGYYHQRQSFYESKKKTNETPEALVTNGASENTDNL